MRAVAVEHVALTAAAFAKMVGVENAVTKNWVGAVNVRLDAITGMLFLGMITREMCALATEPAPKARASFVGRLHNRSFLVQNVARKHKA